MIVGTLQRLECIIFEGFCLKIGSLLVYRFSGQPWKRERHVRQVCISFSVLSNRTSELRMQGSVWLGLLFEYYGIFRKL